MPSASNAKPGTARTNSAGKRFKLSRQHKPIDMDLDQWQIELRKQFGREQNFKLKNRGTQPVFSEFSVTNPESANTYQVSIRGIRPGENFCTCPDFATNTLGTCKHIEFTLAHLERKRGGKQALAAGYQPPYSEVFLQYGARREVQFRPGVECPVSLSRLASRYFGSDGTLLPEAFGRFDKFLADASQNGHELRCHEDVLEFVAEHRDAEHRRKRLAEIFAAGARSAAWNKLLRVPLYDYQREGALFSANAGRSLIGDEMGLGKTVQAIAAAEILARYFGVERALVVCPTSLKHQWEREISRFVDRTAVVIGGMSPRRRQLYESDAFFKITNYDTVHADLDLIQNWSPDLVILDEAQRIKNWKTRLARSVKKIKAPHAIVLTGTPLENRLEELVSIVQFVDRFRLGPTFRFLHNHQIVDDVGRVVGYRELDRINATLKPILIRRQKKQVLDQLPERLDKIFFVPMTAEQRKHHEENRDIVAQIVAKWRRHRFLSEADQRRLMAALQNMRMSCDSSYLLDPSTESGVKADELVTLLDEMFERPDTKVVVFSQWLRMHELLVRRLQKRRWEHVLFHGGVAGHKRASLVDRFRNEENCKAFLSTDAGGVGLNLQFASVVVNMDLPWNPAVLEQRIGRVHRLGQRLPVRVVNFVAQGTIEEGMLSVLKFKKSLFAGALDGGDKEVFLGGSRLNRFMETVEKATTSIPEVSAAQEASDAGAMSSRPEEAVEADSKEETAERAATADPWQGLLETGMAFLQQLATPANQPAQHKKPGLSIVGRDERTGESFIRLPMPRPEVLEQALSAFTALLDGLRR